MNTQDKIQMNIEKQELYCITVGELKNMFNLAANKATIIDKTAERICGSELEEVVVYADKEKLMPILKQFAANVWDEAVKNQIENECMRQPPDRQSMYRKFLLTVSDNPYRREAETK